MAVCLTDAYYLSQTPRQHLRALISDPGGKLKALGITEIVAGVHNANGLGYGSVLKNGLVAKVHLSRTYFRAGNWRDATMFQCPLDAAVNQRVTRDTKGDHVITAEDPEDVPHTERRGFRNDIDSKACGSVSM